jgi:hypothetical protein
MSWTNESKPNTSYSNDTKSSTSWADNIEYLISEALAFLLTEDSRNIITNQSLAAKPATNWAFDSK